MNASESLCRPGSTEGGSDAFGTVVQVTGAQLRRPKHTSHCLAGLRALTAPECGSGTLAAIDHLWADAKRCDDDLTQRSALANTRGHLAICPRRSVIIHYRIARARAVVAALRTNVLVADIPRARREWGGANVIVSKFSYGGRYREIVTPHALQISWMFEQLRGAFDGLVDSVSKFELYGRLEIAANAAVERHSDHIISATALCHALLDEADAILVDMRAGRFSSLPLANGVEIALEARRSTREC